MPDLYWMREALPFVLLLAALLDLLLGDPEDWPHLIKGLGFLIERFEKRLNPGALAPRKAFGLGILLAYGLPALLAYVLGQLLRLVTAWSWPFSFVIQVLVVWQLLAVRSLADEAKAVARCLEQESLGLARAQVGRIVGRRTEELTAEGVAAAAIEAVAESFCDAVLAPLFFLVLAGLPGMLFYKVVNTLDSMLGHRDPRRLYFGRASARLDDVLNLIPARLGALLLLLAGASLGYDGRQGWAVFLRDRKKHLSPNAGQTEAAMAGLLGIQLGGSHVYGTRLVEKPSLGDAKAPIDSGKLRDSLRILYGAVALALFLAIFVAFLKGRLL